jgi:tryptophanyl-tRNA synthetase
MVPEDAPSQGAIEKVLEALNIKDSNPETYVTPTRICSEGSTLSSKVQPVTSTGGEAIKPALVSDTHEQVVTPWDVQGSVSRDRL